MELKDLALEKKEGRMRLRVTVNWEECDEPNRELYIETESLFAEALSENYHPFLVGCIIPAMHFGEKRIRLKEKVCPTLLEGLKIVQGLMIQWSKGKYRPISIESEILNSPRYAGSHRHGALFLSGGIDSLAALRTILDHYPKNHPGSVRDCFMIHGFDIGGVIARGLKYHVFDRAVSALSHISHDAGVELIPVYTNIRHLCDDRDLWLNKFFGAVLGAVAHAFSKRIHLAYIASSYDIPHLHPCGSHPLLDPSFSSSDLQIIHRDLAMTRMEKIRKVAAWDAAFQHLRVCLANVPDRLNCGKCEKCVRTMLELLAVGVLHKTDAFVEKDVFPEHLSAFSIRIRERESFYREILPLLAEKGRKDLVEKIEEKLLFDPV
ncbi:MAG: hypothetical protein AB1659_02255 [Thermodesulfobacteriota bacterium]